MACRVARTQVAYLTLSRMTLSAWEQIPMEEYDRHWGPFEERYGFFPGHGIDEPAPSVTIDLTPKSS